MGAFTRPTRMQANSSPKAVLPYELQVVDSIDTVTGRAGLSPVIETMRGLGLDRVIESHLRIRKRSSGYSEVEKVEAMVLLLASGGDCVDDMAVLRADAGLCRLLGRQLPSADAMLSFLYAFHDEHLIARAEQRRNPGQVAFIPRENAALDALAAINTALVTAVAAQGQGKRATLDHDATIQESHKREAKAHYKGGRGYQPVAVCWSEQDLVLADEYRDGNVPAGMGNLPLIRKAFAGLPGSVTQRYFRADSACYDQAVLQWLVDEQRSDGPRGAIGFAISADMTTQLHWACAALPEQAWQLMEERPGETVFAAEVEFTPGDWPKSAEPLRYVAVRFQAPQGQLFANGSDTRYLAVVSNRRDLAAVDLLRWHWEKAGSIEHVHHDTKNELGAATPPSGRFGANAAWYRFAMLTYNALSAMKSLALPPRLGAARPKKLRFSVFNLPARIASHAGKSIVKLARQLADAIDLYGARRKLARLLLPPAPA